MAGKGSGRRLAEINKYLEELNWVLRSDTTNAETKKSIMSLHGWRQIYQSKIADISTSEERRSDYRKILDGDLPVIIDVGGPAYFPWSKHPEVIEYVKKHGPLVVTLVTVAEE